MCVCVRKIKHTHSPAEVWSRGMEVFSTPAPVDTRRYPKMLKRQGEVKGGDEGAGYKWGKALWDIQRSRHRKKTRKKRLRGCRGDTARCQNGRCCIRTLPPRRRGWMFFSPGWCGTKQPPEAPSARGKTRRKGEKTRRAPGREREVSGGKTEKVNRRIENTEGIERRRRWCWASLGWHDGRGTSVKPARIHDTTSGWRFQSKMCSVSRPTWGYYGVFKSWAILSEHETLDANVVATTPLILFSAFILHDLKLMW